MYKSIIKPLLFKIEPEKMHNLLIKGLKTYENLSFIRTYVRNHYKAPLDLFISNGLTFTNRIGLSAGFDKTGEIYDKLADFGFGFIEIGTITPSPQTGNASPRIFRLPKYESIISRTGFNNPGYKILNQRIDKADRPYVLGININKDPASEKQDAARDIILLYKNLSVKADYFTINFTSFTDENLQFMLEGLKNYRNEQNSIRPVLLKIPADMNENDLDKVLKLIAETNLNGIIACGPTQDRSEIKNYTLSELDKIGPGGVSGRGIGDKSLHIVKYLRNKAGKNFLIIGAGGIMNQEDALKMREAGADLIQIYSAFIYSGPDIIKKITKKYNERKI
ncbi:quinone-dependent dihydroorotate dehydrogenase [Coprobacter tertius]|uniref:Dihydroorotate dehydrogenase (quinone) n=1 Tax=Coprobacter tertius TaxID=2944915 RepID=A0ABT1MIR3_9BACT|nr:quinone-dependent dihydroorotate dehydrogenase [Coprobacter tertius]MCP9612514.1 quinone-dependent dihydroorotate dehydrogenase [Coprobacter tertius]